MHGENHPHSMQSNHPSSQKSFEDVKMPIYVPSYVANITYGESANPPKLDKIVFTIDHIHRGGPGIYSTYDVVAHLVKLKIPVTIFMECTDPANLCRVDKKYAKDIYQLDPHLISLGVHALPKGHTQEEQSRRLHLINDSIEEITGLKSDILSYHGADAGPEPGITFENIKYARGINTWVAAQRPNKLDTPIMFLNSVDSAFKYTKLRNKAGLTATLFVHSVELRSQSRRKLVFDALIKQVIDRKLQALNYYSAMELDYSHSRCPLKVFSNGNGFLLQNLYFGHRDGSGPVRQVRELQIFLNLLGYGAGETDGVYGSKTAMAVLLFQVDNNLPAYGQVGVRTRESINSFCDG